MMHKAKDNFYDFLIGLTIAFVALVITLIFMGALAFIGWGIGHAMDMEAAALYALAFLFLYLGRGEFIRLGRRVRADDDQT